MQTQNSRANTYLPHRADEFGYRILLSVGICTRGIATTCEVASKANTQIRFCFREGSLKEPMQT